MNKAILYLITGANGSGKSTLVPLLKKKLTTEYDIHDIDEFGVPENVDSEWRRKQTRYWMRIAKSNAKRNIKTVLCGLTIPEEVYKIKKNQSGILVRIGLLDVSAPQIKKRLMKRFSTPAKIRNLKKVTGLNVSDCISANVKHAKVLRQQCRRYKCRVFNTSHTTPLKTVAQVVRWLQAC